MEHTLENMDRWEVEDFLTLTDAEQHRYLHLRKKKKRSHVEALNSLGYVDY